MAARPVVTAPGIRASLLGGAQLIVPSVVLPLPQRINSRFRQDSPTVIIIIRIALHQNGTEIYLFCSQIISNFASVCPEINGRCID